MTPPICFVDTETTGLDPDRHEIWEVALIVPQTVTVMRPSRIVIEEGIPTEELEYHAGQDAFAFPTTEWVEYHWLLPVDLGRADPVALSIGRFHERHPDGNALVFQVLTEHEVAALPKLADVRGFAYQFAALTAGMHLAGAVVSFDEERLRKLLRSNGACPEWHYHLIDVENLAAGWIGAQANLEERMGVDPKTERPTLPWSSEALSKELWIDPDDFDRHTALGDARWAKAIYEAVMGRLS